jgi:hypothetical protein
MGITQGTASIALLYGGGKLGALGIGAGTLLVFFVFALSLKFGTKNIKRGDAVALILALLAIVLWWRLKNPLLAVLTVSAIDGLGYIPTYRKCFTEPWSETLFFWAAMAASSLLGLLSVAEYNLLTVTYLVTLSAANIILLIICIIRRKSIPRDRALDLTH